MAMERVWARDLVRCSRDMRRIVVAMAGSVMAIGEDSQVVF